MSVSIETTEELQTLLRKLGVKVSSVDELRNLLASLNAQYNPQAARIRTAKLVALSVPCSLGGIAGAVSMLLTLATEHAVAGPYFVGALALVWGSCAVVSVTSLIFSFSLLLGKQARGVVEVPPAKNPSTLEERVVTAITSDLSV